MKIKAKLLKSYLSAVSKVDNEPCLNIGKAGLSTVSVDPAHVCIMSVDIPASEDLVITEGPSSFCLDSKQFSKYLGSFKNESMLDLVSNGQICTVTDGKITFTSRLIDPKQPPKLPNITLNASATIPVRDIKAVISSKYDNIRFSAKDGILTVSAGDEQDSIEVINKTDFREVASATYPADYLGDALLGENMTIEFGNDLPCRIMPDLDGMTVVVLIAPRIEND